jgi:pimeloyl-ACP methyl ester carboxylesterase
VRAQRAAFHFAAVPAARLLRARADGRQRLQPPRRPGQRGTTRELSVAGARRRHQGQYDCIHEFSEVDFTDDLKAIDKPTLIIHGDDDQIVPIGASAVKAAGVISNGRLEVYSGGGHGLAQVQSEKFTPTSSRSSGADAPAEHASYAIAPVLRQRIHHSTTTACRATGRLSLRGESL